MVGIMSDSHDNVVKIRRAVGLFRNAGCDLVIHAGDIGAPFALRELQAASVPVKAVFGNCDGERLGLERAIQGWGEVREAPLIFPHAGLRFVLTHLDGSVEGLLASTPCDVLIFGHTHRSLIQNKMGVILINPGETGGWLYGKSTAALFDPEKLTADIVPLD